MWRYERRSIALGVIGAIILAGYVAQSLGWISFEIPEILMFVFSGTVFVHSLAEAVNRRRSASSD